MSEPQSQPASQVKPTLLTLDILYQEHIKRSQTIQSDMIKMIAALSPTARRLLSDFHDMKNRMRGGLVAPDIVTLLERMEAAVSEIVSITDIPKAVNPSEFVSAKSKADEAEGEAIERRSVKPTVINKNKNIITNNTEKNKSRFAYILPPEPGKESTKRRHFKQAEDLGLLVNGKLSKEWMLIDKASKLVGLNKSTVRRVSINGYVAQLFNGRRAYVYLPELAYYFDINLG